MKSVRDESLVEYALRITTAAEQARIEHALEGSAELREKLNALEHLFGELASTTDPVAPSLETRGKLLASVGGDLEGFVPRLQALFGLSAQRIRELLDQTKRVQQPPWEPGPGPGIRLLHFDGGAKLAGAHCGLVWMAPGGRFPAHRHQGREVILVLSGGAEQKRGPPLRPGDPLVSHADSSHALRATEDEPLLFAVVLEGGLDWFVSRS